MKLGVRLPNWLGDALLARRALDSLAAARGAESLAPAGPPALIELLRSDHPRAHWIETGHGLAAGLRLAAAWRALGISEVVSLPNSLSARMAAWRSGARQRLGFSSPSWGWTRAIPRSPRGRRHLEDEYLDLARAAGGSAAAWRRLVLDPVAHERAARALASSSDERYVVIAPGARYGPAKRWPAERFADAAAAVCERGHGGRVVAVGEAEDAEACARATRRAGFGALDLAGRTDLLALAGVLAGAAAVLSNDSGVAHLAAALERPTVVVFGSTDPRWTAPRGRSVIALWDRVRCAPCFRRACPWLDDYACLRILEPHHAVSALERIAARSAA